MAIKCGYKTLGGTPKTCESDDHVVFASGVSQLTTLNPVEKRPSRDEEPCYCCGAPGSVLTSDMTWTDP